jgi:hypothetical protein
MKTLSAIVAFAMLSCCTKSDEPFNRSKCELKINTILEGAYQEESWRFGEVFYPTIVFDVSSGDEQLLHTYMKQKSYFSAATDPDNPATRNLRFYMPDAPDDVRKKMAQPGEVSRIACEAAHLSSVKLEEVLINSNESVAFRVNFQ